MEDKKRIFWYCEKWQPGGIQTVQVNLLNHFDLNKFQFDIAVSEDDTDFFDSRLETYGVRKIVTLSRHYRAPFRRVMANIFAIRRFLHDGNYDIVHFNVCHGVELIYLFWAWYYRVPVRIVHCRNNGIGAGGRSRKLKIMCHTVCKHVFRSCANVKLANSDLAARWLFCKKDMLSGAVHIINNGIEASRYSFSASERIKTRNKLGLTDKFVVGHIGHFSYQKNHEFLLHIMKELVTLVPNAVLLLIGTGERQDKIEQLADQLGISDHVIFGGITDNIPEMLWAMDAFVLPSRFEGFGNVLIEAQAAGLKCFASEDVIPKAVKITDNLTWVSLQESYSAWARQIAEVNNRYIHRDYTQKVIDAGYDCSAMADYLTKIYQNGQVN